LYTGKKLALNVFGMILIAFGGMLFLYTMQSDQGVAGLAGIVLLIGIVLLWKGAQIKEKTELA
jgi:hypothetical protein